MLEKRRFNRGELFGIKIRTNECRTGYKVICLGAYDASKEGFRPVAISTEGVGRGYQIMRFEQPEDANEWAAEHFNEFCDNLRLVSLQMLGTSKECVKLPVADFDIDAWVDAYKLNFISDQVKEQLPQYLDADSSLTPTDGRYRGFSFNW